MLVLADSFDVYSGNGLFGWNGDAVTGNQWSSGGINIQLSTTTRFGMGRSINLYNTGSSVTKSGSDNHPLAGATIAFMQKNALTDTSVGGELTFSDGATAQCTVCWLRNGNIVLKSGNDSGAVLATYVGAFEPNSFDSWQIQVVIDSTAGSFRVKKNRRPGYGSYDFEAVGLNTRGGTSNNYWNSFTLGGHGGGGDIFFDDVLVYNGNNAGAPYDWTGDRRPVIRQPITDTAQKQFTQVSSGALALNWSAAGSSSYGFNADIVYVGDGGGNSAGCSASQGGLLSGATVNFGTGFSGHVKLAVYELNGNQQGMLADSYAGTLIGVSAAITNPAASQAFTFSPSLPIKANHAYAYALISDAAFTVTTASGGIGQRLSYYNVGITYAGGFPASLVDAPPAATNTSNFPAVTASLTATNAGCVSDASQDGSTTYLQDSVVGHYDLCNLDVLPFDAASILGIRFGGFFSKSDSGGRGVKITGMSGATAFDTAEFTPLTTYGAFSEWRTTDPNTGGIWTPSAVNAPLQLGAKVSS